MAAMRISARVKAYATLRPRRNYFDLLRYLVRRPAIAAAVVTYETAIIVSNKADPRYKQLAAIKASSRIGCPF